MSVKVLRRPRISEVSLVDSGDNPPAVIKLVKRRGDTPTKALTKRGIGRAIAAVRELPDAERAAAKRKLLAAWLAANQDEPKVAKAVRAELVGREPAELDGPSLEAAWAALEPVGAAHLEAESRVAKWLRPLLARLGFAKQDEDDEPRDYEEVREDWSAGAAMGVLGDRLDALRASVCEILMSEAEDKEARIQASLDQFSTAMAAEVGEILAGRVAKGLGSKPLTDPGPQEGTMPKQLDLSKLSEPIRARFAKVKLDALPAEAQEALGELVEAHAKLTADNAALLEKAAKPVDPDDLDPIMKGLAPEARAAVKADRERQAADLRKRDERIAALETDARRTRLTKRAEPYKLFGKKAELVAVFEKAETAGILDDLDAVLRVAHEAAEKGKVLEELGSAAATFTGSAHGEIAAIAKKLREAEPKLTDAQAFAKAMRENPAIAKRHRQEQHAAAGKTVN